MIKLITKKKQIDPKTLRKHSQIVQENTPPILVVGARIPNSYGFTIPGYSGSLFETFYAAVSPQAVTPTWKHEKKVRVYRVISGSGIFKVTDKAGDKIKVVTAGDECIANPGESHSFTASTKSLELFVTQDAKYFSRLEETSYVDNDLGLMQKELQEISEDEKMQKMFGVSRRRMSKATQQIANLRGDKTFNDQGLNKAQTKETFFRNEEAGINAKPIMDFNEDGAG